MNLVIFESVLRDGCKEQTLETLRQVLSVPGTWCQLWAFPLLQDGGRAARLAHGCFCGRQGNRQAESHLGSWSSSKAYTFTPEKENGTFRQWVCKAGAGLCSQRKPNTPLLPCSSQLLGKVSGRRMGLIQEGAAGRRDRPTRLDGSNKSCSYADRVCKALAV